MFIYLVEFGTHEKFLVITVSLREMLIGPLNVIKAFWKMSRKGGRRVCITGTSGHSHKTFTLRLLTRAWQHIWKTHPSQALVEPTPFPPSD